MKKKSKKSPYKKLYNECWKLMSLYVRTKGAMSSGYNTCVTCGVIKHFKELHAGHYKHRVLDFDELNINPQCSQCNTFNHGKADEYYIFLVKKYGQKMVNDLRVRAKNFVKYSYTELEEIKKDLENKIQKKDGYYEIGL